MYHKTRAPSSSSEKELVKQPLLSYKAESLETSSGMTLFTKLFIGIIVIVAFMGIFMFINIFRRFMKINNKVDSFINL